MSAPLLQLPPAQGPQPGDIGHLLAHDEPLLVLSVDDYGLVGVVNANGDEFSTFSECIVIEVDGLDEDLVAILYARWIMSS